MRSSLTICEDILRSLQSKSNLEKDDSNQENTSPQASHPILALQSTMRDDMIALHLLYPQLFVPALDLLDNGYITRIECNQGYNSFLHLVKSTRRDAQYRQQRQKGYTGQEVYIVRLHVYHCSCPVFTLAMVQSRNRNEIFCKHLLAVLIAEVGKGEFKKRVKVELVTIESFIDYASMIRTS